MYDQDHRFDRMEALRLWTVGSSWFSTEQETKGSIVPGQLADLAVLSCRLLSVAEDEIKSLESVLTIVGGKPVCRWEFADLAPPFPPVLPEWSPAWRFGPAMQTCGRPGDRVLTCSSRTLHHHRCKVLHVQRRVRCFCWALEGDTDANTYISVLLAAASSSLELPLTRHFRKSCRAPVRHCSCLRRAAVSTAS